MIRKDHFISTIFNCNTKKKKNIKKGYKMGTKNSKSCYYDKLVLVY